MNFLIDTNVISEAMAKRPAARVLAWISAQPLATLAISAITVGEIDYGLARLPAGRKQTVLRTWRDDVLKQFRGRILHIDSEVAATWGVLRAKAEVAGGGMPAIDAIIAATAEIHNLVVVTRNAKDFAHWGGRVLNPWEVDSD